MKRLAFCLLLFMLLSTGCGGGTGVVSRANVSAPAERGFLRKSCQVDGREHRYTIFIPHEYSPTRRWPTILFLHGIGEAGKDGVKHVGVGLGPAIAENPGAFPFIAIFPQSSGDWKGDKAETLALKILDQVSQDYSVDDGRVILTGLSTGGYGTWTLGAKHKAKFAALVPMCAYVNFDVVDQLTDVAIWCFHNAGDPFVSSGGSKEMCKRIKSLGGNVKYTQYGALGHDVWIRAYKDPALSAWMLSQHR